MSNDAIRKAHSLPLNTTFMVYVKHAQYKYCNCSCSNYMFGIISIFRKDTDYTYVCVNCSITYYIDDLRLDGILLKCDCITFPSLLWYM